MGSKNLSREMRWHLGNGIPGAWKEIQKEETYYKYGDSARKFEIPAIGKHGDFLRIPNADIHDAESLIGGRFAYTVGNKPLSAGYAKTGAYVGEDRKLDAVFRVKCFHGFSGTNASAPTVQLQSIMVAFAVIAYRKWNFRVMDVSRAFLRSEPLERGAYAKLPEGSEQGNAAWKLLKPLYGLGTTCKDWYRAVRNFSIEECGGEVAPLDKSVFFWTQEGFSYGYGRKYRDLNKANLDKMSSKRVTIF